MTDRLRATVMGKPAEAELDALLYRAAIMREALMLLLDCHDEHDPRCSSLFDPPSRPMECDCELGIIEGALRASSPARSPRDES